MLVGCETKTEDLDYRSPYVGNFTFSSYSSHSALTYLEGVGVIPVTSYGDTIIFEGSIEFDIEQDSAIMITYRSEESGGCRCGGIKVYGSQIITLIQKNGELSYPSIFTTCAHATFLGSFSNTDSLNFHVGCGSLAVTDAHYVVGTRIK